jgi:fructose-bisphosphate aldolase, class I
MNELHKIAKQMMAKQKGILAADESNGSADKRLAGIGVEGTEEMRRQYRELFIGTKGIGSYLSGIILYDETMHQKDSRGEPFLSLLQKEGVLIGIKVDEGKDPDPHSPMETLTKGLAGLKERLPKYYEMGARFAKWRAVIKIDHQLPTHENIEHEMAHLAMYARLCQDNGIVPMVEPEVLLAGDHSMHRAADVVYVALKELFEELEAAEVDLKGLILKTSMVLPGKDSAAGRATPEEVAKATVDVLKEVVPKDVAGVVFLSGGQEPEEATENLRAINALQPLPWPTTFSYARAIQGPVLEMWRGNDQYVERARKQFIIRLEANVDAITRS